MGKMNSLMLSVQRQFLCVKTSSETRCDLKRAVSPQPERAAALLLSVRLTDEMETLKTLKGDD